MYDNERNSQLEDGPAKIPRELIQFLNQNTYSLLIKGHAGTGKTTLALTILRELDVKTNCLYISTRISPEQLFQYYSWLEKFFNKFVYTNSVHIFNKFVLFKTKKVMAYFILFNNQS